MKFKILVFVFVMLKIQSFVFANEKPKFPHEIYYIEPHPKAKFNVLKNGFRYILFHNPKHNGNVLVSLYVSAGAIHEKEGQQGVAHFVEHMAFNGTKNYSSDSLTKFLSNMGMSLAEDANAKTGLYNTEYIFSLQNSLDLDSGLNVLADFAMNIVFDKNEIEKEKGVILSEKRFRNELFERTLNRYYQFVLPNMSFAQNIVIGDEAAIQATSQEICLDYYNRNYRPNNMVLIIVGDINFKNCEKIINEKFGGFIDKSSNVQPPILLDVNHKGVKINYVYEEGMPFVNIKIGTAQKIVPPGKSYFEISKAELAETAFNYIIQKRLVGKILQKDCPLNSFNVKVENFCNQVYLSSFEANCEASKWEVALSLLNSELNKAINFGFLDSELQSFKDHYLHILKTEIDEKASFQNQKLMNQILYSLKENKPFVDTKQSYKYTKELLEILSKEMVHKEFKKYWECDHRLINVIGNVLIKDPELEIQKVYDSTPLIKQEVIKKDSPVIFPYNTKPKEPWNIIKSQEVGRQLFSRYFYSNNVIVNFVYSSYKENQVYFEINMGLGDAALPKGKEALSRITSHAMNFGGLEKVSYFELKNYLSDKNVDVYFNVRSNCFTIKAEASSKSFELALQVSRAMLLNPGFRPEAEEVLNKTIQNKYVNLETDILAYFNNALNGILAKGSPILFWPEKKEILAVNLTDAKIWLQEQLKDCAIEINVVGDKNYKEVRELIGLYFGSLPKRNVLKARKMLDLEIKTNFNIEEKFPAKINKSLIAWIFPTVDYRNIYEVHKLNLLQVIMQEKINKLVREKLSLSYTPEVEHVFNENYKNNCYLKLFADTNNEDVASVQKAFEDTIKELLEVGVTQEEFAAAIKVATNHTRNFVNSKRFLLDFVLAFSSVETENVSMMESYFDCYSIITLNQIKETIKKYLNMEKKSVYILRGLQE